MLGPWAGDAFVHSGRSFDYDWFRAEVVEWNSYLAHQDVTSGTVVLLRARCSPYSCAAFLALAARGAVVVPVNPGGAAEFEAGVAQIECALDVDDDGERGLRQIGQSASHPLYSQLRQERHPGLVLFSSGSAGSKKGSVLDLDKVFKRYIRKEGSACRPWRVLNFLSLDHIGGVNTFLHTLSRGGAIVTVRDRTPDSVFATIAERRVQVLPTTPTFLTMALGVQAQLRHRWDSLELITYGTEPMAPSTLARLNAAFPSVRFKQTYGLSELGILPTRSASDASDWMALGASGFDHKIIDGVLWIRSDSAMLGYLNAAADFDAEGYFNTQDVVEVRGEFLRVLGRRSELINVGGEKVYPAEVEDVILQVPNIAEVVVRGRPAPVMGMAVTAVVRLQQDEARESVQQRVRDHCRASLEAYKVPVLVRVTSDPLHSERFKKVRRLDRDE